jgi:hypothetical protein
MRGGFARGPIENLKAGIPQRLAQFRSMDQSAYDRIRGVEFKTGVTANLPFHVKVVNTDEFVGK